jgi:glyoxalase/bleomycin resistance protein/dioxygenase superfamily protein
MFEPGQGLVKTLDHVSIVVHDLEQTVRDYVERGGLGPWAIYTYAPPDLQNMRIRGKPATYSMRLALAWADGILWELIQPLEGPSVYREFLDTRGEGVHHVGQVQKTHMSLRDALAAFEQQGCPPLMEGSYKGTDFAYVATDGPFKVVMELVQRNPGWRRPAPERWYPSAPRSTVPGMPGAE